MADNQKEIHLYDFWGKLIVVWVGQGDIILSGPKEAIGKMLHIYDCEINFK